MEMRHCEGNDDAFNDMESYSDGGFIAVGRTMSFNAGGSSSDAYIVKLNGQDQEVDECDETNEITLTKEFITVTNEDMPWVTWENEVTPPILIGNAQNISMATSCVFTPVFESFIEVAINMFPNPASDQINLSINNYAENNLKLLVTNYVGQIILQNNINWQTSLSVFDWPKGVYRYHLKIGQGASIATGKFIVN